MAQIFMIQGDHYNSFIDTSKYFWNSLSDIKFDTEAEFEVRFLLQTQGLNED